MPGILYFQDQVRRATNEAKARGAAAGVTMNVGQTFLHNAKDRRLHIFRQAAKVRRHFNLDRYSASLGETIDVPVKRGLQPKFIQLTRVKQVRNGA